MKIESAKHIHAHLVARGTSCRAWAIEHGYNPRTVQKYVQKYAPDTGCQPKRDGSLAVEIMRELYLFIEHDPAHAPVSEQGGCHD